MQSRLFSTRRRPLRELMRPCLSLQMLHLDWGTGRARSHWRGLCRLQKERTPLFYTSAQYFPFYICSPSRNHSHHGRCAHSRLPSKSAKPPAILLAHQPHITSAASTTGSAATIVTPSDFRYEMVCKSAMTAIATAATTAIISTTIAAPWPSSFSPVNGLPHPKTIDVLKFRGVPCGEGRST